MTNHHHLSIAHSKSANLSLDCLLAFHISIIVYVFGSALTVGNVLCLPSFGQSLLVHRHLLYIDIRLPLNYLESHLNMFII